MEYLTILLRVLLIMAHLIAFAAALFLVLREDLRLLTKERLDLAGIAATARGVSRALAALFVTGSMVIYVDTGFSPEEILARPKLLAKISVVLILALNGFLMHHLVFPALQDAQLRRSRGFARLACLLGAVSTVSWLYATFLGIAKPLTEVIGYAGFMAIYAALLVGATLFAQIFVLPRATSLFTGTETGIA